MVILYHNGVIRNPVIFCVKMFVTVGFSLKNNTQPLRYQLSDL